MESQSDVFKINRDLGFQDGGFFPIEEAMEKITHNQDKSLVNLSFKKYLEIKEMDEIKKFMSKGNSLPKFLKLMI